jgi:hypothetical protein
MCALESRIGEPFNAVMAAMGNPALLRFEHVRGLMWAGLQRHHKGIDIDKAGDLIDAIGTPEALRVIGEAIAAAFPTPDAAGPLAASPASPNPSIGTNKSAGGQS